MKKVKLGDCATFINGYAFKPTDWKKAGIPIVRIQDLTGSVQKPNFYEGNLDKKYIINNGDILISWSGSLGIYEWNKGKAYLNQHIFKVEFNKIEFNKRYFFHLIKSKIKEILKNTHGSTMKHITKNNFDKIQIELHSIEEQQKIAQKLDKIQKIIEIRKKQIEELDELIKSKFIEMFGNININNKKWKEDILKNQITIIGGYAFKSSEFKNKGIPVLRIGNINTGYFRNKDLKFWNEEKKLERYLLYPNDIVISLTGTVGKEDYGNVCILKDDFEKYYLNQRNAKLKLENTLDKYFITYALKTPEIKRRLTGVSRGIRQANISNKDIENLKIPIPPIELQNQFGNIVEEIDKQKEQYRKNIEITQELMNTLMNQYFN